MEFIRLLIKIAQILEELKIDYCVSGGYAVSVWGRPRSTLDIDIVVKLQVEVVAGLARKLRFLSKVGYLDESLAEGAARHGGEFNFIHPESGIKIDFWVIKKGDKIGEQELSRRVVKKIDGQKIYFISSEDLILSKLRWFKESGSDRHLDDIKSVLKFSKIDLKYLKQQAIQRGVWDILSKLY